MTDLTKVTWFIPAFAVLLWLAVCFLISWLGGWRLLARYYEAHEPFTGQRFWCRSGQLNHFTNYNGCLHLGAGPQGLHLSVLFLFAAGHRPLLIPWSDITVKEGRILFFKAIYLSFAKAPNITLRLRASLAEQLFTASGAPGLRTVV
jgi:hypothetical protein